MILIHNIDFKESFLCHKLSYSKNTYQELINYIGTIKKIDPNKIRLYVSLNGVELEINKKDLIMDFNSKLNFKFRVISDYYDKKIIELINKIII